MSSIFTRNATVEIVNGNVTTSIPNLSIPTNSSEQHVRFLVNSVVPIGHVVDKVKLHDKILNPVWRVHVVLAPVVVNKAVPVVAPPVVIKANPVPSAVKVVNQVGPAPVNNKVVVAPAPVNNKVVVASAPASPSSPTVSRTNTVVVTPPRTNTVVVTPGAPVKEKKANEDQQVGGRKKKAGSKRAGSKRAGSKRAGSKRAGSKTAQTGGKRKGSKKGSKKVSKRAGSKKY
jgi:hypothetical protein